MNIAILVLLKNDIKQSSNIKSHNAINDQTRKITPQFQNDDKNSIEVTSN
jgi:hypothetical protein